MPFFLSLMEGNLARVMGSGGTVSVRSGEHPENGIQKDTLDLDDRDSTLQEAGLDGETKLDILLQLPAIWLYISLQSK